MTDDAFGSVLVPILKELRGFLGLIPEECGGVG